MQALRRRGVDAQLVVFNRYRLHPEADLSLDRHGGLARRQLTQWRALRRLLPQHRRLPLLLRAHAVPRSLQFPLLRALGKKSVMHFLGSDIRGKTPDAARVRQEGRRRRSSARYDAIRWVPEAEMIPPGIDVSRDRAHPADRPRRARSSSTRPRRGGAREPST